MDDDATPFDILRLPFVRVSAEVKESRLAICLDCDQLNIWGQCRECGCVMPLKVRVPSARCPLGKWDADKEVLPESNE